MKRRTPPMLPWIAILVLVVVSLACDYTPKLSTEESPDDGKSYLETYALEGTANHVFGEGRKCSANAVGMLTMNVDSTCKAVITFDIYTLNFDGDCELRGDLGKQGVTVTGVSDVTDSACSFNDYPASDEFQVSPESQAIIDSPDESQRKKVNIRIQDSSHETIYDILMVIKE